MAVDEPLDGPMADEPRKRCESYMFRYDVQVLLNRMVAELAENQPEEPIGFLTNLLAELQTERQQQELQQKALHASIFETVSEEDAAAAALRIQSAARGRQARKRVEGIREERGVPVPAAAPPPPPPAPARGAAKDLPDLDDPELAAAALKIQSLQRGRAARARVDDIKKGQAPAEQAAEEEAGDDLPDLNDPDLAAAALKIQSLQRGRAARARVEDIKKAQAAGEVEIGGVVDADDVAEALNLSPEEAEAAAVRIQAVHRGRQARKMVAVKRESQRTLSMPQGGSAAPEQEDILEVADVAEAFANLTPQEAEAAAVRIQAIQRGRIARKQMAVRASQRTLRADE